MIKENIKKFIKLKEIPFIVLILIYTLPSLFLNKSGDDVWFAIINEEKSLFTFIFERYQIWTSRIIIETILVLFAKYLPIFIYKICNLGMFYLLVYSISKLISTNKSENMRETNIYISIFIFLIPFSLYFEAGWIATSTNYLWVAATGIYSILLLKRIICNEKTSTFQKIIHFLCLIYACNQEQMAGILFIIYSIGIIYLIKNKKIKLNVIITYLIIICSIIFILTCPGNAIRKQKEEETWYNGFSELSLIEKAINGINSMMDYTVKDGRVIFYIFEVLLWFNIYLRANKNIPKIIGIIPLVLTIFFKYFCRIFEDELINSYLLQIGSFIVYCLILIFIEISILILFDKNKQKQFLASLIYFCGFISRFIMMFSPTVFESGERTSLFFYISLIILNIIFIKMTTKKLVVDNTMLKC